MRMEQFRDTVNIRDLGGYPTRDGRVIKCGYFYRSGTLAHLTEQETKEFYKLKVKTIIDLRTDAECRANPDPEFEGVAISQHSGVVSTGGEQIDFSPKGMHLIGAEGKKQLKDLFGYYTDMPYHNDAFRILLNHIKEGNLPVVFHCHSGKDRTGVAAMVILGLLGCDRKTIMEDYLLSNRYCEEALKKAFAENDADLSLYPERKELLQMQHGVLPAIGESVLNGIYGKYGSMENYLIAEYDFTEGMIVAIRAKYTE